MIMSFILFFIVLAILILSHEFGHFIVAKKSGIRVDEFGFGFPPRLLSFKKGETIYSLNLIPFGGFVKIHGEEGSDKNDSRSFASKSISIRSLVIVAGVVFNIFLAWILIIAGFSVGMPVGTSSAPKGSEVKNHKVVILQTAKNSPAESAGLKPGDQILNFSKVEEVKKFIDQNAGKEMEIKYKRGEETLAVKITPRLNPPEGEGAIGIAMDEVGTVKLSLPKAFIEGSKMTYQLTTSTALSIFHFVAGAIKGTVGLSAITGPVGIAGVVSGAAKFGFVYFLNLMAFLSINLAIINILPFPALDGGRLLFLLIEKIKGSPVSQKTSSVTHGIGMAVLMLFMLVITYRDIIKLVS